jgi:sterol desaturase/sphingolipid hydroxylase (fatty acid hydroxylase superfamily)
MDLKTAQIASAVFIAASALFFIWAERRWPYEKGLKIIRQGFWTDLIFYTFLQSYVAGILIANFAAWLDRTTVGRPEIVTHWPIWAQLVFFLVLHDLYIWWFHKLCHENKVLWRLHEAHHSPREVDWLSGVRSHFLEIMINGIVEFTPIVLLGAAPEVAIYKGTISAVWGMFIHSNLDVRLGPLVYLINGPELHRWHHGEHKEVYYRNYATKLAIWDWLFRTIYHPGFKPRRYGLPYRYPLNNYFKQHRVSIRPLSRKDAE